MANILADVSSHTFASSQEITEARNVSSSAPEMFTACDTNPLSALWTRCVSTGAKIGPPTGWARSPRLFRVLRQFSHKEILQIVSNCVSSEQPHPCCSQLPLPLSISITQGLTFFVLRMAFNRLLSTKLIKFLTPDKPLGDFLHEMTRTMTVCSTQKSLSNPLL